MWIEVDSNDPSSLKKAISKLQKRRRELLRAKGYQEIKFQGTKYNFDNLFPVFDKILPELSALTSGSFYVYAHCDTSRKLNPLADIRHAILATKFPNMQFVPVYVGKGTGVRAYDLNRDGAHRKIRTGLRNKGMDFTVIKLAENLSEESALFLEGCLIDALGLKCLYPEGMLTNLDEGDVSRRSHYLADPLVRKMLQKYGYRI